MADSVVSEPPETKKYPVQFPGVRASICWASQSVVVWWNGYKWNKHCSPIQPWSRQLLEYRDQCWRREPSTGIEIALTFRVKKINPSAIWNLFPLPPKNSMKNIISGWRLAHSAPTLTWQVSHTKPISSCINQAEGFRFASNEEQGLLWQCGFPNRDRDHVDTIHIRFVCLV